MRKISSMSGFRFGVTATMLLCELCGAVESLTAEDGWRKHTVYSGAHCSTAVAADFTGDELVDVICNAGARLACWSRRIGPRSSLMPGADAG